MVKVYTLPNCPMCEELKSYMKDCHILYEEANVEEDNKALAKMKFNDVENYPAVEINGEVFAKDVDELKKIVF